MAANQFVMYENFAFRVAFCVYSFDIVGNAAKIELLERARLEILSGSAVFHTWRFGFDDCKSKTPI